MAGAAGAALALNLLPARLPSIGSNQVAIDRPRSNDFSVAGQQSITTLWHGERRGERGQKPPSYADVLEEEEVN